MAKSKSDQQIGYILRSYPRLSQTFVLNEVLALERIGVSIRIFAITNPEEQVVQPEVKEVKARVSYLERTGGRARREALRAHFAALLLFRFRYLLALLYILRHPQIDRGYSAGSRMECFTQAVSLALLLRREKKSTGRTVDHLHAHFAHDPALIAYLVHRLTGIPYSFTAHARDLYQVIPSVLADRIHQATAVVTCCRTNLNYLNGIAPSERAKFSLTYHGVNLNRFQPGQKQRPASEPPLILSAGRLIEKKGFFDLLQALRIVKEKGLRFRCEIYGEGPLQAELEQRLRDYHLTEEVILAGSRTQAELVPAFQEAALFALTPVVTEDGDRDGIPNVLVEAMAVGVPVVSTTVAGIPELVLDGQNGLLYAPRDVEGIAAGIIGLLNDEAKRREYGEAARRQVSEHFDVNQAALKLRDLYYRGVGRAGAEYADYPLEQADTVR